MHLKNNYYWFQSAISPEICKQIIDLGNSRIAEELAKGNSVEGTTKGRKERGFMGSDAINLQDKLPSEVDSDFYVRDSKVAWLEDQWIYDLVLPFIEKANRLAEWKWDISGTESFQFTKYESPDGFYGWHKDGGSDWHAAYKRYIHGVSLDPLENGKIPTNQGYAINNNMVGKIRKISMTLNLNSPGDYDGGNLKFDFGVSNPTRYHVCEEIRPQGSMVVFPSFLDHCVTPVTKGTRYSLVLWTLGAPWR
jgi:PKHD-type hydroxylase